jgi:hypothetical protein
VSLSKTNSSSARVIRIQPDFFGFGVQLFARRRVVVELLPWSFRVLSAGLIPVHVGLADGLGLRSEIIGRLGVPIWRTDASTLAPQVETSLTKGIERHRLRLVGRVPSEVHRAQQRIQQQEPLRGRHLHLTRELYERRYLVADVLKFRAAAVAVAHFRDLCTNHVQAALYTEPALDLLEKWPALFSPDGLAYRSLRRTLASLSDEVPATMLPTLRFVRLPRPITDPFELTAVCAAADTKRRARHHPEVWPNRLEIFLQARSDEIRGAVERLAVLTGRRLEGRSFADIDALIRYLDFPDIHNGRLGGLLEKAIRWHGHVARRGLEEMLEQTGLPPHLKRLDTPTARPEFPLPNDPRVRFLDTVGSVLEEGRQMGHCVATLAASAVQGVCHLFHVALQGEKATIELDRDGRVVEAAGPGNSDNEAVRWGCRALEECARAALGDQADV